MTITQNMQKIVVGALVVVLFVATTATASAQTNYDLTRASLLAQIERLLIELIALENRNTQVTYQFRPTAQVLGISNSNARIDVETLSAREVDRTEASVYGNVNLRGQSYADVWFQYGRDTGLGTDSDYGRMTSRNASSFRADIESLRSDTRYYYRAAARDSFGRSTYGRTLSFTTDDSRRNNNYRYNDDEPEIDVDRADQITQRSAEISGDVDMNDFRNGVVFFVYGEDENQVEDIANDYDEYRDIDEDGDDLQIVRVDSDLDDREDYEITITNLDDDTEIFFTLCVEFEDEDDDQMIVCGNVEDFETDRD